MGNNESREQAMVVREENLLEKLSKMNARQAQVHENGMRDMREMFVAQQDNNFKMLEVLMLETRRREEQILEECGKAEERRLEESRKADERRLEESRKARERNQYFAIGLVVVAYITSLNAQESSISVNSLIAITCIIGALFIFIEKRL